MNELALFAGAGGGILGGKLLGWRTVCAVEIDAYCRASLAQRQNDGALAPFPIWDDVCTFDGHPWRGVVDVVSGGFPCQDISVAGTGKGLDGERSGLWKEFARIVGEVGPQWVFVENSPALTSRGLGRVLGDLACMGYDAEWGVLGAVDAGAPHRRYRVWIVAYADCGRELQPEGSFGQQWGRAGDCGDDVADAVCHGAAQGFGGVSREAGPSAGSTGRGSWAESGDDGSNDADANGFGQQAGGSDGALAEQSEGGAEAWAADGPGHGCDSTWWATEPAVGRMAHGVAHRVDRLRAIGNGQVPQVAAMAFRILSERMRER
jgi:DNA (cytosine-5)-methyltransferase 1